MHEISPYLLTIGEGLALDVAQFDVVMVDRVVGDEVHGLDVGFAIFGQIAFVAEDVHDFGYEVIARFALVEFLLHATFQRHREVSKQRGIHVGCLFDGPARLCHLVGRFPATGNAHVVGSHQSVSSSKGDGEFRILVEVVRGLVRAERNHDFMHIPLAAPGCIHCVWPTVFVVGADNQYGLWKNPRIRFEAFHFLVVLLVKSYRRDFSFSFRDANLGKKHEFLGIFL